MKHFPLSLNFILAVTLVGISIGLHEAKCSNLVLMDGLVGLTVSLGILVIVRIFIWFCEDMEDRL